MIKRLIAVVTVAFLATGCATVTSTVPPAGPAVAGSGSQGVDCEVTEQVGCIEFDVLNLLWDESNQQMAGLQHPWKTHEERLRRVTDLGTTFYKQWKVGEAQVASRRTFYVFFWNTDNSFKDDQLASYVLLDKNGSVRKGSVVRANYANAPVFDPIFDLGPPDRVYQITAPGAGTAIQVPWGLITDQTYILVCSDDDAPIYPNRRTKNEGHWYTPEFLMWMKEKGRDGSILPFLSAW